MDGSIDVLLALAFAAHLLCVNVAAMGPLFVIRLDWQARHRNDETAAAIACTLARRCWQGLLIGGLLGATLGLLLWLRGNVAYFDALAKIPNQRLEWLGGELGVYLLLMIPFAGRWRWHARWPWLRYLIGLFTATNLLYHFPPMFGVISHISVSQELLTAPIDRREFYQLLMNPAVLSRSMHHWLAAAATASLFVAWLATRHLQTSQEHANSNLPNECSTIIRCAGRTAFIASLLQIPVGVWVAMALTNPLQSRFFGDDWLTTGLFIGSLVVAMGLLHSSAMLTLGDTARSNVRRACLLLALTVLLMSAALQRAQQESYNQQAASHVSISLRLGFEELAP